MFMSSIFGMNLFEWDSDGLRMSNMFWLYWAISIPLTATTLALWLAWVYRAKVLLKYFRNTEARRDD